MDLSPNLPNGLPNLPEDLKLNLLMENPGNQKEILTYNPPLKHHKKVKNWREPLSQIIYPYLPLSLSLSLSHYLNPSPLVSPAQEQIQP